MARQTTEIQLSGLPRDVADQVNMQIAPGESFIIGYHNPLRGHYFVLTNIRVMAIWTAAADTVSLYLADIVHIVQHNRSDSGDYRLSSGGSAEALLMIDNNNALVMKVGKALYQAINAVKLKP
jgi:hypothetical protein